MSNGIRSATVAEQLLLGRGRSPNGLDTKPRFVRRLIAERRIEYPQGRPPRPDQRIRCSADFIPAAARLPNERRSAGPEFRVPRDAWCQGNDSSGKIRKLSSGRYQARYRGPDGRLRPAPRHLRAARPMPLAWLSRGGNRDGERRVGSPPSWVETRCEGTPTSGCAIVCLGRGRLSCTRVSCESPVANIRRSSRMGNIDEAAIRRWRKERLEAGPEGKASLWPGDRG